MRRSLTYGEVHGHRCMNLNGGSIQETGLIDPLTNRFERRASQDIRPAHYLEGSDGTLRGNHSV